MVNVAEKIEGFGSSTFSHYIGVSLVILSFGLSISISRSVRVELGSGENSLSLHGEASKLKKEIIQHQKEVDLAKDEIEQVSDVIVNP